MVNSLFFLENRPGSPPHCTSGGREGWAMCVQAVPNGAPTDVTEPRLCATFNAAYVDSDLGEDDNGQPVPGASYKRYPASFAFANVNISGPLGTASLDTRLDADGCVPQGVIPKDLYLFTDDAGGDFHFSMQFNLGDGQVGLQRPDGAGYQILSKRNPTRLLLSTDHAGDVPLDQWTPSGAWKVPPPRIDVVLPVLSPVTNIAATLSHLLTEDDLGLLPDDPSTPGVNEGAYTVLQGGDGCIFLDLAGRRYCESHGSSEELSIGYQLPAPDAPACRTDADCTGGTLCYEAQCANAGGADCRMGGFANGDVLPFGGTDVACSPSSATCFCAPTDDSRWKFAVAHEAGHQSEERGIGRLPDVDYTFLCPPHMTCTGRTELTGRPDLLSDPPLVPDQAPFCSCKYVTSANGLHCLNSIERGGSAQAEGFGQFFASRVWNHQNESDCAFAYYKEFIDHACRGSDCTSVDAAGTAGFVTPPPVHIDCGAVAKWRNRNCPLDSTMGTELDWLGFLYSLNATGSLRAPMAEIFNIYRQTCLPPPATGAPANPNPPSCTLPDHFAFDVAWDATPPGMEVPVGDTACTMDSDCGNDGKVCVLGATGSTSPCAGGTCTCKLLVPCLTDADCPALTTCRDDSAGSPAPCTDGSCLCKFSKPCNVDADCNGAQNERCRDDSSGFPPCTDGSCVCVRYPTAGFSDGAKLQYAGDQARSDRVTTLGNQFGVSRDLTP
jgi:hypothetical protein